MSNPNPLPPEYTVPESPINGTPVPRQLQSFLSFVIDRCGAVEFSYTNRGRRAFPVVIGTRNGEWRMLGIERLGDTPRVRYEWRCYVMDKMFGVRAADAFYNIKEVPLLVAPGAGKGYCVQEVAARTQYVNPPKT